MGLRSPRGGRAIAANGARRAGVAAAFVALAACASAPDGASTAPASASRASSTPAPPAAPVFVQSDIRGKSADAIDALLGAPGLVRREGRGEFRRYALARCNLVVILYPPEGAGHLEAVAGEAGAAKPDLDACLAAGLPSTER
ncbi:MAG: hypothetical protein AAGC56_06595 [Pseudomonadota bacterium]